MASMEENVAVAGQKAADGPAPLGMLLDVDPAQLPEPAPTSPPRQSTEPLDDPVSSSLDPSHTPDKPNGDPFAANAALADRIPNIDPFTQVQSGIQPTAPFAPDPPSEPSPPVATGTIPLAVEPPTSDIRADVAPVPKLDQDELGSGLDVGTTTNTSGNGVANLVQETTVANSMEAEKRPAPDAPTPTEETTQQLEQAEAPPSEPPAQQDPVQTSNDLSTSPEPIPPADPIPAPAQQASQTAASDQEMLDAPPLMKMSRGREDEDEEGDTGPSAKRPKTDEGEGMAVGVNGSGIPAGVTPAGDSGAAPAQPPEQDGSQLTYPRVPTGLESSKSYDTNPITKLQQKALLNVLRTSKKIKAAQWFLRPVDPVALGIPLYVEYIKEPMDLSTMESKLKAEQYPTIDAFMQDLYRIVDNCISFNSPQHVASVAAKDLQNYVEESIVRVPREGATEPAPPAPKKPPKRSSTSTQVKIAPPRRESTRAATGTARSPTGNATSPQTTYALQPDGMPLIRRESMTTDGRPKREIHRPPPRDAIYSSKPRKKKFAQELKFCDTVVHEIFKNKHWNYAHPFLQPVDPIALNLPNYHSVVKKPMDFNTVRQDLDKGNIETAKQFHQACKLVFENCYKFNPADNPVHQAGKKLEEVFDDLWAAKDRWMADHAPVSEPQSPESDASDDEASDEEEMDTHDAKQARLLDIQAQIAKLNSEAQELIFQTTAKRPSPKTGGGAGGGKKGGKSGGGKAASGKTKKTGGASAAKEKAGGGKSKKPPKVHPVTFEEKQEISDAINTLNDVEMRRAVQIIRNGVPQLRDVNDDEMELDIDTIPDPVLVELLKYLRSVRPRPGQPSPYAASGSGAGAGGGSSSHHHHHHRHSGAGADLQPLDDDYEPSGRGKAAGGSRPRKNKPMSKQQQEASIQQINRQLQMFQHQVGSGSDQSPEPGKADDESSDDVSASESEEE